MIWHKPVIVAIFSSLLIQVAEFVTLVEKPIMFAIQFFIGVSTLIYLWVKIYKLYKQK